MTCVWSSGATLWTWQVLNDVTFQPTARGMEVHFMSLMLFRFAHFYRFGRSFKYCQLQIMLMQEFVMQEFTMQPSIAGVHDSAMYCRTSWFSCLLLEFMIQSYVVWTSWFSCLLQEFMIQSYVVWTSWFSCLLHEFIIQSHFAGIHD